ncbi:MAG: Gfo/Idh/MocA family protein, partial [Christensenellales bacterium]
FTRYSSRYDAYLRGEAPNAFKRELSNGSLLDIGVYALHPAVALFGEPRSIFAGGHILEEGRGIDAFATVVMDYQDMQAVIMTSKVHTSHIGSEIQGESGSITIGALGSFTPMALWDNEGKRTDIPTHQLGDRVDMRYELEYFIRQAKSPDPGAWARLDEQTLRVMRLLDEARSQMGLVYPSDEA